MLEGREPVTWGRPWGGRGTARGCDGASVEGVQVYLECRKASARASRVVRRLRRVNSGERSASDAGPIRPESEEGALQYVAPTASRESKCASPQVLRRWASLPLSLSLFVSPALTEEVFALQCAWDTARLLARET